MIARVRRMHDMVSGTTPSGAAYRANDPELLTWVQGTAAYGFLQAYHAYVQPLSLSERNCYYAEGISAAALYGATNAPKSEADLEMLFRATAARLERSSIVFEFLAIMRSTPILPLPLRPVQHLLVRAAIDLTPRWLRTILGLHEHELHAWEAEVVRQACALVDRLVLESNPAVQACRRMAASSRLFVLQRIARKKRSFMRAAGSREPSAIWTGSVGTSMCAIRVEKRRKTL